MEEAVKKSPDDFVMIRVKRKTRDRLLKRRPASAVIRFFTDNYLTAALDHSDLVEDTLAKP